LSSYRSWLDYGKPEYVNFSLQATMLGIEFGVVIEL